MEFAKYIFSFMPLLTLFIIFHKAQCDDQYDKYDKSNKGLNDVPSDIGDSTKGVLLSGNKITKIEQGDFHHLDKMKTLDLGNNQIYDIQQGSFTNNPIQTLTLSGNPLKEFPIAIVDTADTLLRLHLVRCSISSLSND